MSSARKLFTNYGLHLNGLGKEVLSKQIVSHTVLIRSYKMQQMQVFITAKLLFMFWAYIDPIIGSTSNCNYSFWYMSYCKYKSFELEV